MSAKNGAVANGWSVEERLVVELINSPEGLRVISAGHYCRPVTPDTRVEGSAATVIATMIKQHFKEHPTHECPTMLADTRGISIRDMAGCVIPRESD